MERFKEIISLMSENNKADSKTIEKAFLFAKKIHQNQTDHLGIKYIDHLVDTAKHLASIGMSVTTINAGLLYGTQESKLIEKEELEELFGQEIAKIAEDTAKLGNIRYQGMKRHSKSLQRLFFATSNDIRVLIIRLSSRLQYMRSLSDCPLNENKQEFALETLEIYASIASRLGMNNLQGELEDLSFPFVYPKEYAETKKILKKKKNINEKYVEKIKKELYKEFAKNKLTKCCIKYRIKRVYSLYKKLKKKGTGLDNIYDLGAIRVIVKNTDDCYKALGIIHNHWRPITGRIKDFIAVPKSNGYQSLHTAIFTGDGGFVEIQIRTEKMHQEAVYGIASHFTYKNKKKSVGVDSQEKNKWMRQFIEWQESAEKSDDYIREVETDLFKSRIFIFTPRGDVIDLPDGSFPVDFAFAVHTNVGKHMAGVKINGKFVSTETGLQDGDIVEIITNTKNRPNSKWLKYAQTTLAKRKIRFFVAKAKK